MQEITQKADFRSGFVAVLGMSSAGKSALINSLVGEKIAIVSSKRQSTRSTLRGIYTDTDVQIIFVDTPGYFTPKDKLEEFMLNSMINTLDAADVILFLADISSSVSLIPKDFSDMVLRARKPKILAISKVDKSSDFKIAENLDLLNMSTYFDETIPVSSTSGINIEKLRKAIIKYLPSGDMLYPEDELTDASSRFIVSEIIRESICEITHDEIPYSVAVFCEEFEPRGDGKYFIAATIYVERDSQKAIVIGKSGANIKKIGTRSRQILEKVLNLGSFLELKVKVAEKWRKDDRMLRFLGYYPQKKGA